MIKKFNIEVNLKMYQLMITINFKIINYVSATGELIQAVVIVIVIAFTLGVAAWVVCHYRLAGRGMWHERRSQDGSSAEHNHLNPSSPQQSTEVCL